MKKFLKTVGLIILAAAIIFGGFLAYITITDYRPAKIIDLMSGKKTLTIQPIVKDTFNFMTWNIGYAGLGAGMDFFYDGGTKVRPTKKMVEQYLKGIEQFVSTHDSIDFWYIQEVDELSRRSYYFDEVKDISEAKKGSHAIFALNYDCPFVPVPMNNPMGEVKSGLMTFTNLPYTQATRYAYPLIAPWPDKLFLLDRCFILMRFPLENGKDLVIMNTHNSAYIYDSLLRVKELNVLKTKMLEEYNKGNYVIAGGDWNANPPDFKPEGNYDGNSFVPTKVQMSDKTFPSTWHWAVDATAPTNRENNKPFVRGENGTTNIDYFILSPNVKLLKVKTIDLNFENSDHNPVYMKVALEQN
ncbi:MAG: endonuclease/exonuclease/phosphatase family protein [Bacteroidales bacterium]|nr:endonuclease/exonuclease/phosphatase family protein [Bacteroidales bacterium]